MSFSINTNIASLQAQSYLRTTSDFQSKTINRVTSGMRIISSGDDAAGLAIANGYRSDEAVLNQGVRNANDGLSQLQIIDGGISNISQLLDRARTLATQSASGTFTGDRSVVNGEFQSVLNEIDRQAQSIGLDTGGLFAKNLAVFVGGGKANTLGLTTAGTASSNIFVNSDNITFRFQGAGMTSPVDIALNAVTGGSTTLASVLADLQTKVAANASLAKAGISLSTASTGDNLVFTSSSGQQFQVFVTGDSQNKFGLGSFQAGAAGVFDYTTITAGSAYSTGAAGGTGTASVEFSLNGTASPTTIAVSLNGSSTDATSGKQTGSVAFTSGQVDLSAGGAAPGASKCALMDPLRS